MPPPRIVEQLLANIWNYETAAAAKAVKVVQTIISDSFESWEEGIGSEGWMQNSNSFKTFNLERWDGKFEEEEAFQMV